MIMIPLGSREVAAMANRSAAARKAWVTRRAGRGPAVLAKMKRLNAYAARSADALGEQWAKPDSRFTALVEASRKK